MGRAMSADEPLPVIVLDRPFPREAVARAVALVRSAVQESEASRDDS